MNREALANRTDRAIKGVQAEAAALAKRLGLSTDGLKEFYDRNSDVNWLLRLEAIHGLLKDANSATAPTAEIPTAVDVAAQHTVAELRDLIATADYDELERLEQAESEDNGGKGRTTVFAAIEKRRQQLLDEIPAESEDAA